MAFLVHPPPSAPFLLALLSFSRLMGAAPAAVLPIPGGLAWKHNEHSSMPVYPQIDPTVFSGAASQGSADLGRDELLAFLSGLVDRASRRHGMPLSKQEKVVRSPREERVPFFRHPVREKAPCKNFFWKTFSSC
nr:PREDICTED: cortistatin [Anolis carolinensis]|eukprot:XP_008119733.1 PREDICTED: cortistatin [Anolis carolinensis]